MDAVSVGSELPEINYAVEFWEAYHEFGLRFATDHLSILTDDDTDELAKHVPEIIRIGREDHGIDMVEFLKEWDAMMAEGVVDHAADTTEPQAEACGV